MKPGKEKHAPPAKSDEAVITKRRLFWLIAAVLCAYFVGAKAWNIDRPFVGLHAWNQAHGAWFARVHATYGLGYTRGVATEAVGNPPPADPHRYMDHPQLNMLISGGWMWLTGPHEWSLRLFAIIVGIPAILLFYGLVNRLADLRTAAIATALVVMFPISAYFGIGGTIFLTGVGAFWLYFVLIGEFREEGKPARWYHWAGFMAILFVMPQLNWSCFFYVAAIGFHYIGRCIRRRHWPSIRLLAAMAIPSIAGMAMVFVVMLAGMQWDASRIWELYRWRAGKAELSGQKGLEGWGFWKVWLDTLWNYAVLNFTYAALLVAILGAAAHVTWTLVQRFGRGVKEAIGRSPHLTIFLIPALLQLLLLRGTLFRHQYWETPLIPVVALAAAVGLVLLWNLLRKVDPILALVVILGVVGAIGVFSVKGTMFYYSIRWHPVEKIAMWKTVNEVVPPDKKLLTFNAVADSLMHIQSEAKGKGYRAEAAWYIDRQIEDAQTPEEIQQKAATGEYTHYLLPLALGGDRRVAEYLYSLAQFLAARYRIVYQTEGKRSKEFRSGDYNRYYKQRIQEFGMRPYVLFDLRSPARPADANSP